MGMNLFGGLTKEFLLFQQRLDSENELSIYLGGVPHSTYLIVPCGDCGVDDEEKW
ncbi:MAG: hypothetical protein K0R50_4683 [Eubacterium sp.]|jgi:hypothetical protein|nr:hypothetical protein [Eubacterium sp.]